MKRTTQMILIAILGVGSLAYAITSSGIPSPSPDGTKEEIMRLQADVLALKNQISLLDKTFTERTDSIRSLVVQLNDQVGKSSMVLGKVMTSLETQSSGDTSMQQSVLQEIKGLSSKMDDANTRISALAQQVSDIQVQSKPITQRLFQTASDNPDMLAMAADQIYGEAYNDLIQGNLELAIEGFSAFLKDFPTNEKADDAQYSIGEAYYASRKYQDAIEAFARVISNYASGGKVPSALYKRGKAAMALQQKDAAVADFKSVLEKYPTAPEANLARAELDKLGIDTSKLAKPAVKRK